LAAAAVSMNMRASDLPIRFPCPDKQKQISGEAGRLYCGTCDRTVIELEYLTEKEVRKLKKRADEGERICVRYWVNPEGLVRLRPSPPMGKMRAAAAAAGIAALIAGGSAQADATVPQGATKSAVKPCAKGANGAKPQQPPNAQPAKAQPVKPAKALPPPRVEDIMVDGGIG